MRCAVFDLDGTLIDTTRDLLDGGNAAFEAMGHGPILRWPEDALIAVAGGRAMVQEGVRRLGLDWDAAQIHAAWKILLAAYEARIDVHSRPYPGLVPALEVLAARGWALGVCTNKPEALAEILLARLDLRQHFKVLIGADTLPVRKPDPAPLLAVIERLGGTKAQSVLIGDSMTDRQTSRNAGVASVMVAFGPKGADVAEFAPDAILPDYPALPDLLETLFGEAADGDD